MNYCTKERLFYVNKRELTWLTHIKTANHKHNLEYQSIILKQIKLFNEFLNNPVIKKFDLKKLDREVKNFEPELALDGGIEGLSIIRKVIKKSSKLIKTHGKLILEIGYDQREPVKKMLIENNFYINKVLKDLANNDRCIISTKK